MRHLPNDHFSDDLLLAGQRAPAGLYRELGSGRLVQLDRSDVLPASLDGRVACYVPVQTWAQILAAQHDHRYEVAMVAMAG